MEYLGRKIMRSRWSVPNFSTEEQYPIRADAICDCLRTKQDSLSFWQCNEGQIEIEEIVLALAANMDSLETIDVVILPRQDLVTEQFSMKPIEGMTPVRDLRKRHIDISELTITKLSQLSKHIANKVRTNTDCHRFTRSQIKDILLKALRRGRLDLDTLQDRQNSLKSHLKGV